MNILENLKDLLTDMSSTTKAIVIITAICGVLGYAFITKEIPAEETPTTTTKTVEVGEISGGVQGGFNISQ